MGREVTDRASAARHAGEEKLGPAEEDIVPTEKVYFGSWSTLISSASSFGDNLALDAGTIAFRTLEDGTAGGAKNEGSGAGCTASALLTSTLSTWKLYRSLEGSFGAEVFELPNRGLVVEGGDTAVAGTDGAGLPLMGAVSSAGSIISAGRMIGLGTLTSSIS